MKSQIFKNKKKWVIGYIFSRKINNSYIPQKVQNLVIRDYCIRNNFNLILSATEYRSKNSFLMLDSLCNKKKKYNAVVIYSISMLIEMRKYWVLLERFLKKEINVYFALEEIVIRKKKDIDDLKKIFFIKNLNNTK